MNTLDITPDGPNLTQVAEFCAQPGDKLLRLAPGVYDWRQFPTIEFNKFLIIEGNGAGIINRKSWEPWIRASDSLRPMSLTMRDLTFADGHHIVASSGKDRFWVDVTLENIYGHDVGSLVAWSSYNLLKLKVSNCHTTHSGLALGIYSPRHNDRVTIENSSFENCRQAAIQIGSGTGTKTDQQNITIRNNQIKNVRNAPNNIQSHGVWVFGENVLIDGNTIEDVENDTYGTGAEAIYTKALGLRVVNNRIHNGGDIGIQVKGSPVPEPGVEPVASNPYVVSNNIITADPDTQRTSMGIGVFSAGGIVSDNVVRGTGIGIKVQTMEQNTPRPTLIHGNILEHCRRHGIYGRKMSSNTLIRENLIANVTGDPDHASGIYLRFAREDLEKRNIDCSHNTINDVARSNYSAGIIFKGLIETGPVPQDPKPIRNITIRGNEINMEATQNQNAKLGDWTDIDLPKITA